MDALLFGGRPCFFTAYRYRLWLLAGVRPGGRTLFFLLCFIIFCAQHPVSDTNMGLDQMRRIRVSFNFLRRDAM